MNEDLEKLRKEYFKNHEAIFSTEGKAEILEWRNKNFSTDALIKYVLFGRYLFIAGDLGSAVLDWGTPVSFEFLSTVSGYAYFVEKMQAWGGKRVYDFDADLAAKSILEYIEENELVSSPVIVTELNELLEEVAACENYNEYEALLNTIAWEKFIHKNIDSDACEWIYEAGDIPKPRIQLYMLGLHLAVGNH